ncbi:MAG: hypothetical protein JNK58_11945, partial [Phycisphaerae bacterium]|nr:hypothetical protein [Phycisphaerae bacterium]
MTPERDEQELKSKMLAGLLAEVDATRHRRLARRRGVGAAVLLLAAFAAALTARWSIPPRGAGSGGLVAHRSNAPVSTIEMIRTGAAPLASWSIGTDPGLLEHAAAPSTPIRSEWLDDDALLALLAS